MPTRRQNLARIPLINEGTAINNPAVQNAVQHSNELQQQLVRSQQTTQRQLNRPGLPKGGRPVLQFAMATPLGYTSPVRKLANLQKYPQENYLLEDNPGVYYKRQHKLASEPGMLTALKLPKIPTKQNPGKMMEFIGYENVPMIDIDFPDSIHSPLAYTDVRSLPQVAERVQDYVSRNPEAGYRLYRTPGGVRGWDLTNQVGPAGYGQAWKELGVDPLYRYISKDPGSARQNFRYLEGTPLQRDPQDRAYWSRISPKPGRDTDYVAQPIAEVLGTKFRRNPINQRLIRQYHDRPIQQAWLQGEKLNAAMRDVSQDVRKTSPSFQRLVNDYMRRSYT